MLGSNVSKRTANVWATRNGGACYMYATPVHFALSSEREQQCMTFDPCPDQQLLAAGLIGSPSAENLDTSVQQQQEGCSTLIANISSIVASHGDQEVSSKMGGGYAYRWDHL
eukprot:1145081-Pelagomonas_calceolata.AAC.3